MSLHQGPSPGTVQLRECSLTALSPSASAVQQVVQTLDPCENSALSRRLHASSSPHSLTLQHCVNQKL